MEQALLDEVRAACAQIPAYDIASAYDRTKICCRILSELGRAIPGWDGIREIIGKGSATDINRAIKDHRGEQAVLLAKMQAAPAGVPDVLAPYIIGLWDAALSEARKNFEAERAEYEQQTVEARSRAAQAEIDTAAHKIDIDLLNTRIEGHLATIQSTQLQLENERGNRAQAERLLQEQADELRAQRDKLEALVAQNKRDMAAAMDRFDGERKHALNQIEDARRAAAAEVVAAQAQTAKVQRDMEIALAAAARDADRLRASIEAGERRATQLASEADQLRARLNRSSVEKTTRPELRAPARKAARHKTSLTKKRRPVP